MAGIYIHIPFCKQACYYCDFHFSTSQKFKNEILACISKEIELRKTEINKPIQTLYFGGGSPSLLHPNELSAILTKVKEAFNCDELTEITLEANPDDLSINYLEELKSIGINRLSIGVQTFSDTILKKLNRAHTSDQAINSINAARKLGFKNINLDIIFGLPGSTLKSLRTDLDIFMSLYPEHISAYWLTIEEGTAFGNWTSNGKQKTPDDSNGLLQWNYLRNHLKTNGFEQYEISNYSKPGLKSLHNSNYWNDVHYLGIGPSAHSYDGNTRKWNIANNKKYIEAISNEILPIETEHLDLSTKINEYIMTKLRTSDGISIDHLKTKFNLDLIKAQQSKINQYIASKDLILDNKTLKSSIIGQQIVDEMAADLFI